MASEYQQSAIEQVQILEILAFISDKVDVQYITCAGGRILSVSFCLCQVTRILGSDQQKLMKQVSLTDELQKQRGLALERAKMEADFEHRKEALEKIKVALTKYPDLDIDKVTQYLENRNAS